ncbi:MAG: cell surface protein SprA [Candidatus Eisenbacteria bacterium]
MKGFHLFAFMDRNMLLHGRTRRVRRFLVGVSSILLGVPAFAGTAFGLPADVQRGNPVALIRNPVDRNYPEFFGGLGFSPYREARGPLLKGAGPQGATTVRIDRDRALVIVKQEYRGIPIVHPWVVGTGVYLEHLRRFGERDLLAGGKKGGKRLTGDSTSGGAFNIDLPVRFPRTLSRIIGQGANIQVSGSESITFSGETQYFIKQRDNESGGQRKFPELDMRQQLQINMTGTIGEKVKVEVQHNSESQVPLENRIKLRYDGFEDEVIQKIEVGNTNLSLPGNQFVGFSAQQQGLFGVKAIGKAGKLDFTAILSQQQGRTDRESYTGSSREDSLVINDMDFVKNRYFVVNDYDSIIDIRVFVDDDNVTNNDGSQVQARAYVNADANLATPQSGQRGGWFDEMEEATDYFVNREIGILVMNKFIPENQTLAVWCSTATGGVGRVPQEASYDSSVAATLKLIKPPVEFYKPTDAQFGDTWYYQLRNVYDLRARGIQPDGFQLKIFRKAAGAGERFDNQAGRLLLTVMGLDLEGSIPGEPPDDRVDIEYRGNGNRIHDKKGVPNGAFLPFRPTIMVDYESGLLYFPDLRPFDPAYNHQLAGQPADSLLETNAVIYDNHDPKPTDSKYEIEVKYRTSQSSFSLNRSNILEGSEVVKLNGRTLTRGVDYRIIYEIGQIEFLSDEALAPDAKISVDFEYAPFLSQAQKSLAGVAGTYNLSDRTKMSSIWLYKGKKTPYRRPRLGQEPSRIVVGGLSLSTEREPEFLTRLTDMIPGVTAREKSRFRIDLESAVTFPNPNTKNAVYVDDMEGTEETSSFGITRRQWNPMSIPSDSVSLGISAKDRYKRVLWYNPKNSTTRGDLNPDLSQEERTKFVPVLEVDLRDGTAVEGTAEGAWGGIMRLLSKTGLDMKERKFLEIWINDFDLNRGRLNIDMGLLGEDAMWGGKGPNGQLDTEDRNLDGVLDDTGTKGPNDEDTGLDRLFNAAEAGEGGDPAGDDWAYDDKNPDDYSKINGTEDNGFLDTEDLNGNGYVDDEKAFFRFSIDLGSDEFLAATGNQDGPNKNWRLFRIPLAKAEARQILSQPTFDKGVKYVRFFFTDLDTTRARFQIYSMEVTGNRWLEAGIQDSSGALIDTAFADPTEIFAAGVINNKDGEDYDPPPVEIIEERGVSEREQSLVLTYENIAPGHTGTVFRALFDDEDYTRYEEIEFWVKRRSPEADFEPYPDFFFRFGGDSLNFYEFSTTLDSAVGTGWQKIVLDLAKLTQIKIQEPDTLSLYGRKLEVRRDTLVASTARGPKSHVFSAVGRPSMTKIRRLTFGISNRSPDKELTGSVWVNDLRLLNVKGDAGYAARIGMDVGFSDFLTVSTDYRKMGKEFRHISGGGGGGANEEENPRHGSDETELSVSGSVKLGKFLDVVGVGMPVNASYSKSTSLPELQTGSDIVLTDPEKEKAERKTQSVTTSISRNRKARSPWIYYSLDAMALRLGGRRDSNVNPTKADSTWSYNVDWSYGYAPRFKSDLKVFRSWVVDPLPSSFSLSASRERSENRSLDVRSDVRKVVQGRKSNSAFGFAMRPVTSETFSSDFSFNSNRDHLYGRPLSFLASVNRGFETQRGHQGKLSYSPRFISALAWFKPRLSYNTKYTENMPVGQRKIEFDQETGDTLSVQTIHNVQNQNSTSLDFGVGVAKIFELLPAPSAPAPSDSGGGGSKYGPMTAIHGVRDLGSRFGDVTASLSLGRDSRYDRLVGRPGLKYQFGLSEDIDSLLQERTPGQSRTANTGRDISARASSSFRLVPSMSLRWSYNTSLRRSNQSRNTKETRTTTWPDLSYTWDGVQEVWKLKDWLKSASLDVGYNKRSEESGKTLKDIESERVSIRWDPLFSIDMEWGNGIRSSLTSERSREVSRNFRGGSSEKISTASGIGASFSYKTSSRKTVNIPILGKGTKGGSFTATTNFSLDFRYDTSKEEQTRPYRLDAHTRSFSMRPRVSWTWLQNLSGSLELQFGERRNLKNENRSTRTIGASISALFKF